MNQPSDLSELYDVHGARLRCFLQRLTQDEALAEDLIQETFVRALDRADRFRAEGKVSNWLYRIATNLYRDHLRRKRLAERARTSPSLDGGTAPSAERVAERHAVTRCVRDCIGALPPAYRAVLLLYSVEDRSVEEIASIVGSSPAAVKVRLHRARRVFEQVAADQCEVAPEQGGGVSCLPKRPGA